MPEEAFAGTFGWSGSSAVAPPPRARWTTTSSSAWAEVVARLHLIRHGQAAAGWDADPDPGLDDLGHRQAAAGLRRGWPPSGRCPWCASPPRRTRETAVPLAEAWGTAAPSTPGRRDPEPDDDLAERRAWLGWPWPGVGRPRPAAPVLADAGRGCWASWPRRPPSSPTRGHQRRARRGPRRRPVVVRPWQRQVVRVDHDARFHLVDEPGEASTTGPEPDLWRVVVPGGGCPPPGPTRRSPNRSSSGPWRAWLPELVRNSGSAGSCWSPPPAGLIRPRVWRGSGRSAGPSSRPSPRRSPTSPRRRAAGPPARPPG